jgi:ribonuclease J
LIAPNGPRIIDEVPNGRLLVDGGTVLSEDSEVIKERIRIGENGYIMVALTIDFKGKIIGGPDIRTRGLADKDGTPADKSLDKLADVAQRALAELKPDQRLDEEFAEDKIMKAVRKASFLMYKKRPMVEVVVIGV